MSLKLVARRYILGSLVGLGAIAAIAGGATLGATAASADNSEAQSAICTLTSLDATITGDFGSEKVPCAEVGNRPVYKVEWPAK